MPIFGQVWLWSLASFLVGALLSWLLLARPARKRVVELERDAVLPRGEEPRRGQDPRQAPATRTQVAPEPEAFDPRSLSTLADSGHDPVATTAVHRARQFPEEGFNRIDFDQPDEQETQVPGRGAAQPGGTSGMLNAPPAQPTVVANLRGRLEPGPTAPPEPPVIDPAETELADDGQHTTVLPALNARGDIQAPPEVPAGPPPSGPPPSGPASGGPASGGPASGGPAGGPPPAGVDWFASGGSRPLRREPWNREGATRNERPGHRGTIFGQDSSSSNLAGRLHGVDQQPDGVDQQPEDEHLDAPVEQPRHREEAAPPQATVYRPAVATLPETDQPSEAERTQVMRPVVEPPQSGQLDDAVAPVERDEPVFPQKEPAFPAEEQAHPAEEPVFPPEETSKHAAVEPEQSPEPESTNEPEQAYEPEQGTDEYPVPASADEAEPRDDAPASLAGSLEEDLTPPSAHSLFERRPDEADAQDEQDAERDEPDQQQEESAEDQYEEATTRSLFEPVVAVPDEDEQHVSALATQPGREPVEQDAVTPGPFGPGSAMPVPGGGSPSPEYTVKASVTALRYCTQESPQFGRIVAEVWFKSAGDAERVGFRPLS